MTDEKRPTKPTLMGTLTGLAHLSPELRRAPAHRQEQKVKSSALGLVVVLFAFGVFAFTGYLATRPVVNVWVLCGFGGGGAVLLAFGALLADRETVWPVLVGLVKLLASGRKAWKA